MQRSKVEILSRDDISRRAIEMISATFGERADLTRPAPLKRLVEAFVSRGWLTFSRDQDLGTLPGNRKIYGEFRVSPLQILIDRSLEPWSPRFCFSVAHEIGHFVLHRRLIGKGKYIDRGQLPPDSATRLRYREMASMTDLGWAEWQANEFALSLIMPALSSFLTVKRFQEEMGIRNAGFIYLDHQACNRVDFAFLINKLQTHYQIPHIMIRRRLRHLGILHDHRPERVDKVRNALGSLFYAEPSTEAAASPQ